MQERKQLKQKVVDAFKHSTKPKVHTLSATCNRCFLDILKVGQNQLFMIHTRCFMPGNTTINGDIGPLTEAARFASPKP